MDGRRIERDMGCDSGQAVRAGEATETERGEGCRARPAGRGLGRLLGMI